AIKYSSSNDKVASIDADGKLTILSPGTTTITASIEESNAFAAASASYELTVEADPNTLLLSFASVTMNPADGYTQSIKATDYDGVSWSITNFSNGDNEWDYIRCGGNDNDNTASITTDFPIDGHLENIVVTVDNFKEGKIENITLYAYGEANSEHPIESITLPLSVGDIVFEVTPQPGLKYSIVANSLEADPDGTLQISKITYHKTVDVKAAESATLLISDSDRADAVFSECKGNAFESNGTWVILKFEAPDDHTVWHRFVNGSEIKTPTLTAQSFMTRATADSDRHGFRQFTDNAFKHIDNGTLEFYTENAEGTRSAVRSVQFTGVTSLDDVVSDCNEPVEYYNLQGIRIDCPTDAGIYLMRRSGMTVKVIK
ncbi:MAG: Ig-like domain-containing protein, partial [Muribaculaceae bacterium]|nr:Ig-like domain-containing protein [Muribaculaceae bacterium]